MRRTTLTLRRPLTRQPPRPATRELQEALAATAELCGRPLSPVALFQLASDLSTLEQKSVMAALSRCRVDLRGALNIGEILVRLEDGRPTAEEAWHMLPMSEAASVVWTNEMTQAWSSVVSHLQNDEHELAHAVFIRNYTHAVLMARCRQESITWTPSLGTDPAHREQVLLEALQKERLTANHVKDLLPYGALTLPARQLISQLRLNIYPK